MADAPDLNEIYERAGRQWNVDPWLLKSIAHVESREGTDPNAVRPNASGAQGVMQFIPETAKTYNVDVNDPWSSIYGAAHYYRDLLDQNGGNIDRALAHYGNDMDGHKGYAASVRQIYDPLVGAQQNQQPTSQTTAPTDQPAAPNIVDMTKQAGFGNKFGDLGPVQGMIIHHTGGGSDVNGVISTFKQTGFPAQFVIGKDGTIYQTLPDGAQGQQIQKGTGLGTGLSNANTIGVEIIAKDNNDVTPAQIAAGQQLTNFLGQKYNFNPYTQVYGHGEVNPGHKEPDEGQGTTYAQRYAMGTGPQPPAPGTVPPQTLPPLPPGQPDYRGGLPPTVGLDSKGRPVNLPTIAFNSQGVPYNPYTVGAHGTPAGVSIPAQPSPGVVVAGISDDVGHLFAPQQAPAAQPQGQQTMATKPVDDEVGHLFTPQQATSTNTSDISVTDPEIYPTPYPAPQVRAPEGIEPTTMRIGGALRPQSLPPDAAPTPDTWFGRNIGAPVSAMLNPLTRQPAQNYLLGIPALQEAGTGLVQGARNVAETLTGWAKAADRDYPALAAIDRAVGMNPAPGNALMASQRIANQTALGGSPPYELGKIGGELAATYPIGWVARPLQAAGEAVPYVGRALGGAAAGGAAGALQSVLTSPDLDPLTAAEYGGVGGAAIGGTIGTAAGLLAPRGVPTQSVADADRLGFNLSAGDAGNPFLKRVEDVTEYYPFSGAGKKENQYRQTIANTLLRNLGEPETGTINLDTLNTARTRIGNMFDQLRNVTVDTNQDPGLLSTLQAIRQDAGRENVGAITGAVHDLETVIANHGMQLPGPVLADQIAQGGAIDKLLDSETPNVARFGRQIKTALLDAASRTADSNLYPNATQATQDAVNAYNQARYQYKVLSTISPLVTKTGNADDSTYAALARRIQGPSDSPNFDSRFQYQNNEMQALARVLQGPLAALKSSGTGRQLITAGLLGGVGLGGGGAHIFAPEFLDQVLGYAPLALTGSVAGRLSRFGPGLGNPLLTRATEQFNPIMPRMTGPALGQNWLMQQQPQPAQ